MQRLHLLFSAVAVALNPQIVRRILLSISGLSLVKTITAIVLYTAYIIIIGIGFCLILSRYSYLLLFLGGGGK